MPKTGHILFEDPAVVARSTIPLLPLEYWKLFTASNLLDWSPILRAEQVRSVRPTLRKRFSCARQPVRNYHVSKIPRDF
jgi:hypothetical protein